MYAFPCRQAARTEHGISSESYDWTTFIGGDMSQKKGLPIVTLLRKWSLLQIKWVT